MKNLKISGKLSIINIISLLSMIIMGIVSSYFLKMTNDGSTNIVEVSIPAIITAEELQTNAGDYRRYELNHLMSTGSAEMDDYEKKMEEEAANIEAGFQSYESVITSEEDRQNYQKAKSKWDEYLEYHDQFIPLSRDGRTDEAIAIARGDAKAAFDGLAAVLQTVIDYNKNEADQFSLAGDRTAAFAMKMMWTTIVIVLVVVISASLAVIRMILVPVRELNNVSMKIAQGDLNESIRYESRDELGVLSANFNKTVLRLRDYVNYIDEVSSVLNQIADGNLVFTLTYDYAGEFAKVKTALENISDTLNDTMANINQASEQVASGSDQVSSGAQALSQGATEQASSVEELAATINEISGHISKNAENAREASDQASMTAEELEQGKVQMQSMTNAMDEIDHSASEIEKIIKTIEDIAFQTNILALNAAVEAARAGAAGKGFAVVADEVRNLASKSAEASKNTASLIEATLSAVKEGKVIADATAASFDKIMEMSGRSAEIVHDISDASQEQAASVAQVTQGIDQISSVVQTNSATAEESAAASEELSGQAQILKGLVAKFKLKNMNGTN